MKTPPIVSQQEWEGARQQLLVKEKELTSARHAMAAQRRRMPWMSVDKKYEFDGSKGKVSLLDLFEGRRQLVVYRAFYEPGVFGWPDHACRGCSFAADQVSHLSHLNARDTTLAFASRAPQADIARLKARMGWQMPWYTITDSFDVDFGVDQWYGYNAFIRDGGKGVPNLLHQRPRSRGDGEYLELPRYHAARPSGNLGRLTRRLPPDRAVTSGLTGTTTIRPSPRRTRSGSTSSPTLTEPQPDAARKRRKDALAPERTISVLAAGKDIQRRRQIHL